MALIVLATIYFLLLHVELSLDKEYAMDEFQYAHGGWLIAQGKVIYKDFFEHHLPLIHQLIAAVFLAAGDTDPNTMLELRLLMVPFLLLTLAAAAAVNRRHGVWAVATPLAVLMVPSFSVMAVEVRPDPLAFSLFLAALAVLHGEGREKLRGFVSGFLLVAALWGTLKVVYYGLAFPAALVADLLAWRRADKKQYFLGHPLAFLGGAVAALLPIAVYLLATGSLGALFEWCIQWSFVHQRYYPGFLWTRNFASLFTYSFWLFPFAAVGIRATLRKPGRTDVLLLGTLLATLASFAWQSAAYLYSLVPFTVVWTIFAVRGVVRTVEWLVSLGGQRREWAVFGSVLLALLLTVEGTRARSGLEKLLANDNERQHALLSRIGALTRPDEPVLNISGGQVTRPSVHFFYFFEAVVRQLKHDVFAYELPRALVDKGAVAYMPSWRFERLPEPLRRFLVEHFVPVDEELWFWGQRVMNGGTFTASRQGTYFVWPPAAPGELTVGGRPAEAFVELDAGQHPVLYSGTAPELYVVWLPADAQPFRPRPDLLKDPS